MPRSEDESEPGIVLRVTDDDDKWASPIAHRVNSRANQSRADALPLSLRQHRHGSEAHALNVSACCGHEHRAEENVAHDSAGIYRDKGHHSRAFRPDRVNDSGFRRPAELLLTASLWSES